MEKLISLAISGAVSGAVFSIIAAGLVLSYSTSGIFNFSHAAVAYATALLFYELHVGLGWPLVPSAFVAIVVFAPLLGLMLDRLVFRRLADADDAPKIVATVGLLVAIPGLALWIVERCISVLHAHIPNGSNILFPPGLGPAPKVTWTITGNIRIDSNQAVILGVAAVSALALWYLVRRTRLGLRLRCTVDQKELAALRGINPIGASRTAWLLGFFLAGVAGVVGAPVFALSPVSYTGILFIAATAAVLGGLRSIPLAFAGGLALGVIGNLVAGYATFANKITGFSTAVPFLLLFVGLMLSRPKGQTENPGRARGAEDYHTDLPRWRIAAPWIVTCLALAIYVLWFADAFWVGLFAKGIAYALIFLSFVVVTGTGGMVSLAQATFATTAALFTGLLISHGVPVVLAIGIGVLVAMAAGLVVALPALRLGGLHLALATLAMALFADSVLFAWQSFGNGQYGWTIPRLKIGPIDMHHDRTFVVVSVIIFVFVALFVRNLQRSLSGRAVFAVRSSSVAAAASGVSPITSKLRVFALSAAIAGLGGLVLASFNQHISTTDFPPAVGLAWLAIVVLFGTRNPLSALVAGISFAVSPEIIGWFTSSTYVLPVLSGLGAVQLARAPDGVLSLTARQNYELRVKWRAFRSRRAAPAALATPQPVVAVDEVELPVPFSPGAEPQKGLTVIDLSAGYGEIRVLQSISLRVAPSEIVVLLGANGAGKSTLCRALAGVIPTTKGIISVDDHVLTGTPSDARTASGLVLAPESRGVFPGLSVEENLSVWLPEADHREVAYSRFPVLRQRRDVAAFRLSGGEQQILSLAPLVIRPPAVLIADEPMLGLAPLVVEQIRNLFVDLRSVGVAILLVEEKVRDVLQIADRVIFLELGRVTWSGAQSEFSEERAGVAYLGAIAHPRSD
jgi:ABC-type branched-subunit amino acid transport system ATPase component/branched-subunit amino acid ABC-type transport system permease component